MYLGYVYCTLIVIVHIIVVHNYYYYYILSIKIQCILIPYGC